LPDHLLAAALAGMMTSSVEECLLRRLATLPDAEWGGPPDHKDAPTGPAQAAGWDWELDANGVPVQNLSRTSAGAVRSRRLRANVRQTLPPRPAPHAAVVACMDSRLKIFELLGLDDDEAQVIRNAGGVVTDDVIRSLAVSQRLLGTTEIILIHHTDCGLQKITDDEFKREIEEETGVRPPWAVQAFTDAARDVRESIGLIKASPFLRRTDKIHGFVFDVTTGKAQEGPLIPAA
jgi:carbonic anhydrase